MLAIMNTAVRCEIYVSVVLLSVLGTCVARNISDRVVEGGVPPNKWNADRRETEDVGGAEEGMGEERKDRINVGEYCGHYCLC
jgi:hypothetical protein